MVELAVQHPRAGAHALHVARPDHTRRLALLGARGLAVAHVVLVCQRAVEHVADDLHVAVAMGAEAGARGDAVFVDDPQVAHAHVGRVVVVGKGKAVPTVQPAVLGMATVGSLAQGDHRSGPFGEGRACTVGTAVPWWTHTRLKPSFK